MVTRQVYTNTIAQLGGKIATVLISIFLIRILTNYLTLGEYGLYTKIYNYLSIFATIADLGLYTITIREISAHADDPDHAHAIVGNVMSLRIGMGLVIIVLATTIAACIPGYDSPLAIGGIIIASVFTLFGLVNSSIMSLLQAYLRTQYSFVSTTIGKIANFIGIVTVVYLVLPATFLAVHPDLRTIAFILVMLMGLVGNIVMTLLLYFHARKIAKFSFRWDTAYILHLLRITLPYGLALFLNVVYFKVDIILLSILEPAATADTSIALYSVPMKIIEVGMMFGTLFLNSMLPLFTRAIRSGDIPLLHTLATKAYQNLSLVGIGIVGVFLACGTDILRYISNNTYVDHSLYAANSSDALAIVVYIFLLFFLSSLFTYLLIANEEQGRLLKINAFLTAINLIGNAIVIPYYSFIGSAWVTLVCQVLLLGMTYIASRHLLRFRPPVIYTMTLLGGCTVGILATWIILPILAFSGFVSLIVGCSIFGGIYGGCIVILHFRTIIGLYQRFFA